MLEEQLVSSAPCRSRDGAHVSKIGHCAGRGAHEHSGVEVTPMTARVAALAWLVVLAPAGGEAAPIRWHPERHVTQWRRHVVPPETIRVHDGDTFYTGDETIRLRGIDAPELGQPRALQATARLAELLRAGPVTIVPRAEDAYGRTVADVYAGGRDVARTLRREGYAKKPLPASARRSSSGAGVQKASPVFFWKASIVSRRALSPIESAQNIGPPRYTGQP
jgi:endonuclease YncB( thermonuclease family)